MLLLVDASVLVGELLRERGRALFARPELNLVITDRVWDEAQHELEQRLRRAVTRGAFSVALADHLREQSGRIVHDWVAVLPPRFYQAKEATARRRIPRDPDDWPTVAAALALEAGIWTRDSDFLGCGCPTWTTETILAELAP